MNPEVTIFVAHSGEYSDRRVVGVFSTREAAAEAADSDYNTEEWVLDRNQLKPGHTKYFFIVMDRDGNTRRAHEITYSGHPQAPSLVNPLAHYRKSEFGCYDFREWGRDLTHAVKVANEKRARLIAEGTWK